MSLHGLRDSHARSAAGATREDVECIRTDGLLADDARTTVLEGVACNWEVAAGTASWEEHGIDAFRSENVLGRGGAMTCLSTADLEIVRLLCVLRGCELPSIPLEGTDVGGRRSVEDWYDRYD